MSAVARVALVAAVVAAAAPRRGDGWARVLDALDASIDRLGPPADGAAALRGGLARVPGRAEFKSSTRLQSERI